MKSLVQVSPWHSITLSRDYVHMLEVPPREDFVVRTLAKRSSGQMTLMMGELVIAGAGTRKSFEGAARFPLHFRKTYYPGKMHGDPAIEFERHQLASTLIHVPPPIGSTPNSFRSCFLPGTPLSQLSELGTEPDESNIQTARSYSLATAAGLYRLTEEAYGALLTMQGAGLCHGDAHLHNFIVCPSPLAVTPIDFEIATVRAAFDETTWEEKCREDRVHLLRQAIFLQTALGRQSGPLATESLLLLGDLVRPADAFERAISERSFGSDAI